MAIIKIQPDTLTTGTQIVIAPSPPAMHPTKQVITDTIIIVIIIVSSLILSSFILLAPYAKIMK
jgi:hypothetical protein